MSTDWRVGNVVRLIKKGEEIERREVTYRQWLLGEDVWQFLLEDSDCLETQHELQQRGWRLVQEDK